MCSLDKALPDPVDAGRAHAAVLQIDEGCIDELFAERDMAFAPAIFQEELFQPVNMMAVARLFLVEQTHFVAVTLAGSWIGFGQIVGKDVEDEKAAHTELKSFPGLAFEADTTARCQRMVIAQARAVIRCAEEAAEMAVELAGLKKVNQRIRIALLGLVPAPQGGFLVYILVLGMEVFSCRKQQEYKRDAQRSMRLVHLCS